VCTTTVSRKSGPFHLVISCTESRKSRKCLIRRRLWFPSVSRFTHRVQLSLRCGDYVAWLEMDRDDSEMDTCGRSPSHRPPLSLFGAPRPLSRDHLKPSRLQAFPCFALGARSILQLPPGSPCTRSRFHGRTLRGSDTVAFRHESWTPGGNPASRRSACHRGLRSQRRIVTVRPRLVAVRPPVGLRGTVRPSSPSERESWRRNAARRTPSPTS